MPVNGTTSVPMPSSRPVILRCPPVGKRRHRRSWMERRIAAKRRCGPGVQCGRPEHGNDSATATSTPGWLATALSPPRAMRNAIPSGHAARKPFRTRAARTGQSSAPRSRTPRAAAKETLRNGESAAPGSCASDPGPTSGNREASHAAPSKAVSPPPIPHATRYRIRLRALPSRKRARFGVFRTRAAAP